MILLDTTILSLAFRRRRAGLPEPAEVAALREKVRGKEPLGVPGIVLQELLSGVKGPSQFRELQGYLESFPVILAAREDHVAAAGLFNLCRGRGITLTLADCLIAAQAISRSAALWTLDSDFKRIARHCELKLFAP